MKNMFEIATTYMIGLIDMLPGMIAIYILFDWIGTLLFGRK